MAQLRIFLNKDQVNSQGQSIIYFQVEDKGKRIRISTKIKAKASEWNEATRRLNKNAALSAKVNKQIGEWEIEVNDILHEMRGDFNIEVAKKKIEGIFKKEEVPVQKTFLGYLEEFIEWSNCRRAPNTIKSFKSLKSALDDFMMYKRYPLTFSGMDKDFMEQFTAYLHEKKFVNNYIAKHISCLRTFLRWVDEDKKINVNPDFLKFRGKEHNIEPVYLTEAELMKLYYMPLEGKYEKVRDLFCFGCWTGLRFSDIMEVSKANIKGDAIHLRMVKTKDELSIPLNQYSRAILEKYNYELPKYSNQKANLWLKEIAKEAEFNSIEKRVQYRGIERVETLAAKHEVLSFHDARRTFIILLLIKGVAHRVIMQMSGHKDLKSFEKYIRIADSVTQNAMKQAWG